MKEAFVKRKLSSLVPIDGISEEAIRQIPSGEIVRIKWSRARNPQFHRKYFALLKASFELQDHFDNIETFRFWLTLKSGYFDAIVTPNGKTIFKPKSISFASMGQDEFEELYQRTIDVIIKEFGVTREDVERVLDFA